MDVKWGWLLVAGLALINCTQSSDDATVSEPVGSKGAPLSKDGTKVTKAEEIKQAEIVKDRCVALKIKDQPPFLIKEKQLVVTRIAKPCETDSGEDGFEQNTSYMAMGFPCTGGGGMLEYRENFHNPKIVSFHIPNSCPMKPATREEVQKLGIELLGFHPSASLLAYYPMAVQYWELVDFPDADIGYVVDLRSKESREEGWKQFSQKKGPLKLRLFGRENAWVKDNRFYQADVELNFLGRDKFQLVVVNAKPLTSDEIQEVKKRCEALRPQRACSDVFFN